MAFCTESQVRSCDKKLEDTSDVTQAVILSRIDMADKTVIVDLSSIISETDLETIGQSSKVINLMSIYKSVELTLAAYYGASRRVDELTDISYYQKQYNNLLKKLLDGDIELSTGEEEYGPKDYPSLDKGANKKFYTRKGVDGFLPEGEVGYGETYVEDTIKN